MSRTPLELTRPEAFAAAQSIDEVVDRLDAIVSRAVEAQDRLGFFAALYRTVTAAVRDGIAHGRFEDGPRMQRLDVAFANRYLEALDRYRRGLSPTHAWQVAFKAASGRRAVIIQHLLLGMNAHINLDLGIAAAEVCPRAALAGLKHDFDEINNVLATLEADVEREVCTLSPWIGKLEHIDPDAGRVVANFSIDRARACSWQTAQRLAALSGAARESAIDQVDTEVALLGGLVERPVGFTINFNLMLVRFRETHDVRKTIRVLRGDGP